MTTNALISIICPDRVGLVADISGCLFDLGGNLNDTTFAVLGGGAEFTTVCDVPNDVSLEYVEGALRALKELSEAEISVTPFSYAPVHGETAKITHDIVLCGGNRPGLIARLCEVFVQFSANVVRLNAEKIPGPGDGDYAISIKAFIPQASAASCLATIANTAGELGLNCTHREL